MASIKKLYLPGIYSNPFLLTLEKMPIAFMLKIFIINTMIQPYGFTVFCQRLGLYLIFIG